MSNSNGSETSQDQSRALAIVVISILIHVFATLFYFARVYSRAVLLRSWSLDDKILTFAWLASTGVASLLAVQTKFHSSHLKIATPSGSVSDSLKFNFILNPMYLTTLAATKLSICVSFIRIFEAERYGRLSMQVCQAFIIITHIPSVLLLVFRCHPISDSWKLGIITSKECLNPVPIFLFASATNILGDIWIMATLLPHILKLKIELRQKFTLLFIISLGWLVVAASLLRTIRLLSLVNSKDVTGALFELDIWSAVETNVGIFCASAHTVKPFIRKATSWSVKTIRNGSGECWFRKRFSRCPSESERRRNDETEDGSIRMSELR